MLAFWNYLDNLTKAKLNEIVPQFIVPIVFQLGIVRVHKFMECNQKRPGYVKIQNNLEQ
jgi:hypothetical protein